LEKPANVDEDGGLDAAATASTRGILGAGQRSLPFTLERFSPGDAVAARVDRHWCTRWDLPDGHEHVQEVLPHPCVNLVVHHGIAAVYAIPTQRDARRLTGRGAAVGTKFRPGAFAALCRVPLAVWRGGSLPLPAAFGPDGRALEAELLAVAGDGDPDATDVAAAITVVEGFLAPRMPPTDPGFTLVQEVVRDMLRREPDVRVATIARDHGVSERTLQRVFREHVGVGPKWVLRRYRLHAAAERIGAEGADDLARLAQDLGYADQAHFANDFRDAIGLQPTAYAVACGHR
jgi:AraC-like DNA-binding protein